MKILVIGSTGGTGRALVTQALDAGHQVTALARNADKMSFRHERLRLVPADAASGGPQLGEAIHGHDAVISALGRGRSFKAEGLIERAVPAILTAMQAYQVRRLIFTSAIGVGDTIRTTPLLSRLFIRLFLNDIYADKLAGENAIRRSTLDWTIVQPALLTDGPLTGTYRFGDRLAMSGMPKISRADTAHFILRQLDDRAYIGKVVIVAY
ncbi:MAG TPA: NAD(P)H-binding protein [Vicinamibacterales bacterium]|jgi:putative NADH-flavin reductase